MNTLTVSATDFKNNLSEFLGEVYYGKKKISISKHGVVIATLVPEPKSDTKEFDKKNCHKRGIKSKAG